MVFWSCAPSETEELVEIPDGDFLSALLQAGVDLNGDGSVSIPEAEKVNALRIGSKGISGLTGIEAFAQLDTLVIMRNPLGTLSLEANPELRYLDCSSCELTSLELTGLLKLSHLNCSGGAEMANRLEQLDLSLLTGLEYLDCSGNLLDQLDLSANSNLQELVCGRNYLERLDLTSCPLLTRVICNNNLITSLEATSNYSLDTLISCGNQLPELDLSNNEALLLIGIDNMPTLEEVLVWTLPFPPPGVKILDEFSPNVVFTASP